MQYQIISTYYQLALQGKVPELFCRMSIDHPNPVPKFIDDDDFELECIHFGCNWKSKVGMDLYTYMKDYLERIS